jgi:hypothetical protein
MNKSIPRLPKIILLILIFIILTIQQVLSQPLTDEIRSNFVNPPLDCRPHTRWWWPGNPVSKETITWHLEQMKSHGLGGVEQITMGAYYERGNIPFMSAEFIGMLSYMVGEAKRLDLEVSLNFGGPGWIIGGEWVPDSERSKDIVPTSVLVQGPGTYSAALPDSLLRTKRSWEIYTPRLDGRERLLAVVAGEEVGGVLREESLQVLTERVQGGRLNWPVPAGKWRIMAFWLKRNDHDHAVDHFSASAMRHYCEYFGGRLYAAFGEEFGRTVESMFVDSFELPNSAGGIYWSDSLMQKFAEYKGYDLRRYLPAVWWPVGEITAKIRYDVNDFLNQMGLEAFYGEFVGWCHAHNVKARVQTYGFTTDNIESAGKADIPEMEITPGEKDAADWYDTRIGPKKYVASGAHIYDKKVISSEVYTFIHWERYRATLQELKIASDGYLKAGATKFYNHGYSFTPEKKLAPSRAIGFAANISPTNVWWDYYPLLAEYVARCSWLLRQGDFAADIAVYSPLANQWTLDVLNARKWTREFDWGDLGDLLFSNGYDFDLLNDDALQHLARIEGGQLRIGAQAYRLLILPNIKALPLASLEFIGDYVRSGGVVIALERVPDSSTGLSGYREKDLALHKLVAEMFREPEGRDEVGTVSYGAGRTHFIKTVLDRRIWWDKRSSPLDPFIKTIKACVLPDMGIDLTYAGLRRNGGVSYQHRKLADADIYFVSNIQDRASAEPLTFRVKGKGVWRFDPYSGGIRQIYQYRETENGTEIALELGAYESTFVVFSGAGGDHVSKSGFADILSLNDGQIEAEAAENGVYVLTVKTKGGEQVRTVEVEGIPGTYEIGGMWHLRLAGEDFAEQDTTFSELYSWTDVGKSRHFSGQGEYLLRFKLGKEYTKGDLLLRLDLGKLGETGDVYLNGQKAGVVWMAGQMLDISGLVVAGENELRVVVTNLLINRVSGMKGNPPIAPELQARFGRREINPPAAEYGFEPLPAAGLMGPVQILVSKKVEIKIN